MNFKLTVLVLTTVFFFGLMGGTSAQTIWTKHNGNPVLDFLPIGNWDDGYVSDPKVIWDGEMYRMWYTGSSATGFTGARIGYATSPDGISWTKYGTSPVLEPGVGGSWDSVAVGIGAVLLNDETFKMWFWGYDGTHARIGYATSADGIEWTKHESNPVMDVSTEDDWENGAVWTPSVLFDGEGYQMWYTGYTQNMNQRSIGYATSPDGISWTKYAGNPILEKGDRWTWAENLVDYPVVIYNEGRYQMWFAGFDGQNTSMGYATSTDGITWSLYENNPVMKPGANLSWDGLEVLGTTVLYMNEQYKLWYAGYNLGASRIGYAIAPTTIHVPQDQKTIQAGIDAAKDGQIVLVDEDTYFENINFKGKKITVASHFLADKDTSHISKTIINGSQHQNPDSGTVVYMVSGEDSNSVLCGFTITGGTGTKMFWEDMEMRIGGGIGILNSGATIQNNHIINNNIDFIQEEVYCHGAGMAVVGLESQVVIISDNIISYNTVNTWWGGGAGINMGTAGKILFIKNTVAYNKFTSQNVAGGGGFYLWGDTDYNGSIIINQSHIEGNQSEGSLQHTFGWGGGLYIEDCSPLLTNNVIINNNAGAGAGIYLYRLGGSGIMRPMIINNTISANVANYGGGVYNRSANSIIINTILWNNKATSHVLGQDIFDNANNIKLRYCLVKGGWSGDAEHLIDQDPDFVDAENGDFHLTEFSPCVGRGIDSLEINGVFYAAPSNDCDDNKRPCVIDNEVDIGAYESNFPITTIHVPLASIPESFSLDQNYPNPFNPVTTINYTLPITNYIDLSIYNLLGQKVATLTSGRQQAGYYQVEWDATGFASGMYYYRLSAENFVETKKLVLLR